LVNYSEDIFRQRFTVAHEVAHIIFDIDNKSDGVYISSKWDKDKLKEHRADTFASNYLIPEELLKSIPDNRNWSPEKIIEWATKIKVNPEPLSIALKKQRYINDALCETYSKVKIPKQNKIDSEFVGLSPKSVERKNYLFQKGISQRYINKCCLAYQRNLISIAKMAELLLVNIEELLEMNDIFRLGIQYEN
jgi:hypothetical protein